MCVYCIEYVRSESMTTHVHAPYAKSKFGPYYRCITPEGFQYIVTMPNRSASEGEMYYYPLMDLVLLIVEVVISDTPMQTFGVPLNVQRIDIIRGCTEHGAEFGFFGTQGVFAPGQLFTYGWIGAVVIISVKGVTDAETFMQAEPHNLVPLEHWPVEGNETQKRWVEKRRDKFPKRGVDLVLPLTCGDMLVFSKKFGDVKRIAAKECN